MKRMLQLMLSLLLTLLVAYSGLVALVFFNQDRMVYFPDTQLGWTPAMLGVSYEDLQLTTADGVTLHGWFVPASTPRGAIIYFHGNGGNLSSIAVDVEAVNAVGLDGVFIDYRGYGRSTGHPSEQGLYADAAATWRYITEERAVPPEQIILVGHSLGGGVASWLAEQHPAAGLVLISTFTSVPDVGAQHYPFLPVHLLSRHRYPTIERLPNLHMPLLIAHGQADTTVPYSHSERLYASAQEPKTFLSLSAGHGIGFAEVAASYPAEVEAFLNTALAP